MVQRVWNRVHKTNMLLEISLLTVCLAFIVPFCNGEMPYIDNQFLEIILRNFESSTTLRICENYVTTAGSPGDLYASEFYRIDINGFQKMDCAFGIKSQYDYTKHLIVKIPQKKRHDFFIYEVNVYQETIPALKLDLPPNSLLKIPKLVYAAPHKIFLEDWAEFNLVKVDIRKSYSPETLDAIITELAKFHSASIIMKQNSLSTFNYITTNLRDQMTAPIRKEEVLSLFKISFKIAKLKCEQGSLTPNKPKERAELIKKIFQLDPEEIFENAITTMRDVPKELEIIVHGDFWPNHLRVSNLNPGEIQIIDLACVCRSNLVRDLIYVFATSPMHGENRKPTVEKYLQYLKMFLKLGNVNEETIKKYTVELLMKEMKRLKHFEFVIATILAVPTQFTSTPLAIDLKDTKENRDYLLKYLSSGYEQRVEYIISKFYENDDETSIKEKSYRIKTEL